LFESTEARGKSSNNPGKHRSRRESAVLERGYAQDLHEKKHGQGRDDRLGVRKGSRPERWTGVQGPGDAGNPS